MKTINIAGTGKEYQIGKILCIGLNYLDHISELGNEKQKLPVVFMKPASSVIFNGEPVVIPSYSSECHHEAELAVIIGKSGKCIPVEKALEHVTGYGVAIDMTLRDVQAELKKKGLPWDIAKGFDTACPLSDFVAASSVPNPQDLQIRLSINGQLRQDGNTSLMIHSVPEIISYVSSIFTLEPGDIILTGTPAGVGPVKSGDYIEVAIKGVGELRTKVA